LSDPADSLECYLVGGAVRDLIMGFKVKDRDWVVIGATPDEMVDLGFKPVGKDFPVFLHPQTKEEYALARTERKVARGYHGFEFHCDPGITLEMDLSRRDLTMNAIAMDRNDKIIDPFNGQCDIKRRTIRHVSDAFCEDPVRILRAARFASRYTNFNVSDSTLKLMNTMVRQGEIDALVPERIWQEMLAAMTEKKFSRFIEVLKDCEALEVILPEVDALFGVPQTEKYHPERDTGIHTMLSLDAAAKLSGDVKIMFAVLLHDLGKALTPKRELPAHRGHELRGLGPIKTVCERLAVPKSYRKFALKVCEYHLHCHRAFQLKPKTVLKVIEAFDGFRNPDQFSDFLICCDADKRGRTGHENDERIQSGLFNQYHQVALKVDQGMIADTVLKSNASSENFGNKIKKEIRRKRIAAIEEIKKTFPRVQSNVHAC